MKTYKRPGKSEEGFAAIVVSITIVIVLSLLTVGFAQLMSREQNQVTNRQLSNQAYYAAEAGVNDAAEALSHGYVQHKTSCGVDASGSAGASYLSDQNVGTSGAATDTTVGWSCLLIDPAPFSLEYDSVSNTTPTTLTLIGTNSAETGTQTIDSLTISWQDADSGVTAFRSNSGTAGGAFPIATQWLSSGMLRASLASLDPYTGLGCFSPDCQAALTANTYTVFLYPNGPTGAATNSKPFNPGSSGDIVDGNCNTNKSPHYCSVTITGVNATTVALSLRSIYSATKVSITGAHAGAPTRLAGAQSLVDSTGKAQDVVKRIQVRIPDKDQFPFPGFDVDAAGSLCKLLQVYPGSGTGCGYF